MEKIELNHIIFQKVKEAATSLGLDTYVVGGYVRDQLIGRKSKDIDFVCVGSGIELARKVASLLSPNLKVNFFKTYLKANPALNKSTPAMKKSIISQSIFFVRLGLSKYKPSYSNSSFAR